MILTFLRGRKRIRPSSRQRNPDSPALRDREGPPGRKRKQKQKRPHDRGPGFKKRGGRKAGLRLKGEKNFAFASEL